MVEVIFSEITNSERYLTKTINVDDSGKLVKTPAASLRKGVAKTIQMAFEEFGPYIRSLQLNQAICHGVSEKSQVNIVSQRLYKGQENTITRTKKYFSYPAGYGLGMFDHDPKPGQKALEPEEFTKIISTIWPGFNSMATWWTPSTSSCIYDLDGKEMTGIGAGFHMYFPFEPASKLPDLAIWLFKKLWLAGHGYIFITKDGKMLERTIFDKTVFSPERLDFVAGANCIDCVQRLPEPVFREEKELEEVI